MHKFGGTLARVYTQTNTWCCCYLMACAKAASDIKSRFSTSCDTTPGSASRWCTRACVGGYLCEHKFATVLWLMQDQSFSDPITRSDMCACARGVRAWGVFACVWLCVWWRGSSVNCCKLAAFSITVASYYLARAHAILLILRHIHVYGHARRTRIHKNNFFWYILCGYSIEWR